MQANLPAKGGVINAEIPELCGCVRFCAADCCPGRCSDGSLGGGHGLGRGRGRFHRQSVAGAHRGDGGAALHEAFQEGHVKGDLTSGGSRRGLIAYQAVSVAILCLLPVLFAHAHFDGTPSEWNPARHHYYWGSSSSQADNDPIAACTTWCSSNSRAYHNAWYDVSGPKLWKCQCKAVDGINPGTTYNASTTGGNERHCPLGQYHGGNGACSAGGPANCYARTGRQFTFHGFAAPAGFNVPEDDEADGTPFENLKQCSLRLMSGVNLGTCYRVTYVVTGSGPVDEDGLSNAQNDGASWPTAVPSVCDPDTGDEDETYWTGVGVGGGGPGPETGGTSTEVDFGVITEAEPDLDDPLVSGNEQLEEDTGSWLDSLLDPEEWDDSIFGWLMPDFDLWNVTTDTCGGTALVIPLEYSGASHGTLTISCSNAEQIRDWLGVILGLAFGWWIINTALSLPRTGG